jgi:uncharacterized protein YbaP (TraB family)
MPFGENKLFRLSRAGIEPSYIFGTLHLSDERITRFSPVLLQAIKNSKVVALETIDTGAALLKVKADNGEAWRRATLAAKDRRADRLLDNADFAQLEALARRKGLPDSAARRFKPSVLALVLDLPECANSARGAKPYADERIADIARRNKIQIVGLESMIEQLESLDGLSREAERDLLIATIRQADHTEDVVETTVKLYTRGAVGLLLAWLRSSEPIPGVSNAETPPAFLDRLINSRTRRMRDRALPLLERGSAFIAVGAMHLPGQDGLVSQLKREGYEVELME